MPTCETTRCMAWSACDDNFGFCKLIDKNKKEEL